MQRSALRPRHPDHLDGKNALASTHVQMREHICPGFALGTDLGAGALSIGSADPVNFIVGTHTIPMAGELRIAIHRRMTHSQRGDGTAVPVLAIAFSDPHAVDHNRPLLGRNNMECRFDPHHYEPCKLQRSPQSEFRVVLTSRSFIAPLQLISKKPITETAFLLAFNDNADARQIDVDCFTGRD